MSVLALLWGSTFLWIKLALNGLSPAQVTLTRCALGAGVLIVLCYSARQRLPRDRATWSHIIVAAFFCNALPFALFSIGEQTVDSGVAGVLNATTPLWSLLIGIAIGTERGLHPTRLSGLLLGFAGTLLIFAPWQQTGLASWGSLAILAAAASYAVAFAYMGRELVGKGTATIALSAAQLIAATGLSALALPAGGLVPVHANPSALIAVAILGIFATGTTFYLTYRLIADEGATNAATVGYLLPVVSVVLGAIVLDEELNLRVIAGMVVVLAGVGMTRWRKRKPPPVAESKQPDVRTGLSGLLPIQRAHVAALSPNVRFGVDRPVHVRRDAGANETLSRLAETSGMLAGVIEVRGLSPDDWAVWRVLRLAALAEAPDAFGSQLADWQGEGDREDRWRSRLSIPGSYNIVALLDDQPVGMASGVPTTDDGVVELISMWVAPTARGRGVGDALVREVERWGRDVGARVLRLDVAEGNRAASGLYQRNGFGYTGEQGELMADGIRRERVMAKQLHPRLTDAPENIVGRSGW